MHTLPRVNSGFETGAQIYVNINKRQIFNKKALQFLCSGTLLPGKPGIAINQKCRKNGKFG